MAEPVPPYNSDGDGPESNEATGGDRPIANYPSDPSSEQTDTDTAITSNPTNPDVGSSEQDVSWEEVEAVFAESLAQTDPTDTVTAHSQDTHSQDTYSQDTYVAPTPISDPPLALAETAFLASTASLLWLVSYYLSIGPWMRILFPIPIALVYLRWGGRSGWMAAIVSGLLLSVLMGPYLSILFLIPYGILGVQLGFLWRRQVGWGASITIGTIVATLSLFFRLWLLSTFLGEDLWIYLTGRITDLLEWFASVLVNWGILGVGMLGQPDIHLVQLATIGMILFSDLVYLFTIHLTAWLLMERLGVPISQPPQWVQVILDEA
ncbi:MAG: DUF2232 domain-containing protein [Cyanothece sp. SIO2G6]|nr:DUF2232 domain-containing protein [Cyanothece sp. SIO2G6]